MNWKNSGADVFGAVQRALDVHRAGLRLVPEVPRQQNHGVVVRAGGRVLVEGFDFVVDMALGRISILRDEPEWGAVQCDVIAIAGMGRAASPRRREAQWKRERRGLRR